jgi:hypothetical protein
VSSSLSPSPLAHSPGSVGATCMQPAPLALHRDMHRSWTRQARRQTVSHFPQPQPDKRVVSQDETPRCLARTRSCRDDPDHGKVYIIPVSLLFLWECGISLKTIAEFRWKTSQKLKVVDVHCECPSQETALTSRPIRPL